MLAKKHLQALHTSFYPILKEYIASLAAAKVPADRQVLLQSLAAFIRDKWAQGETARLNFICTHNSRRSQFAQLWAATLAAWHGLERLACYSGGTEATALYPQVAAAMQEAGFRVVQMSEAANPLYHFYYAEGGPAIEAFSKVYNHAANPQQGFAAVMTCSEAEEACPVVIGAAARISLSYEDPKLYDNTAQEAAAYRQRCRQIAAELNFVFDQLKE